MSEADLVWERFFYHSWGFANGRNLVRVRRLIVAADTLRAPMAAVNFIGGGARSPLRAGSGLDQRSLNPVRPRPFAQ